MKASRLKKGLIRYGHMKVKTTRLGKSNIFQSLLPNFSLMFNLDLIYIHRPIIQHILSEVKTSL